MLAPDVGADSRARPLIEVLAIRRLDGRSTVKAFVDVRIGGIILKGCKIVEQNGQKPWLATPSVKTGHGWQNVVELSKPLRDAATAVVLERWASLEAFREHPGDQL
jgi:DNA-binding cell septation regulator SpoVG